MEKLNQCLNEVEGYEEDSSIRLIININERKTGFQSP